MRHPVFYRICCALIAFAWGFPAHAGYGDTVSGYSDLPSWNERCIIVLTNTVRMDPQGFKAAYLSAYNILLASNYPAVQPLYWDLSLNQCSRFYAQDISACGLQQNHVTCAGASFQSRFYSYYKDSPTGGENAATGKATALETIIQWLMDGTPPAADNPNDGGGADGHRENIMDGRYHEMAAGYAYNSGVQWYHFWVEDFGGARSTYAPHHVPAGAHFFMETGKTTFLANYYDSLGRTPQKTTVVIDGSLKAMALWLGSAGKGTYRHIDTKAAACRQYYFVFTDANGTVWKLPESGSYVTSGEGTCAQNYAGSQAACVRCRAHSQFVAIN